MIRSLDGKTPRIDETAFISEAAYIIGDVEIGPHASVWPGAVIRADSGKITIGAYTNIQDNSVLHADADAWIGERVTIGHNVVCHAWKIGDGCLLGNGCVLNDGAEIGEGSLVAANSTVVEEMEVPANSLVVGSPARVRGEVQDRHRQRMKSANDHYVNAIPRYKASGGLESGS
ncbi:MAG: gamma carbonic anhydrase family protein [Chloroflexota bacterium]